MENNIDTIKEIADVCNCSDGYSSRSIGNLSAALSKAQAEYETVGFNRENPFFKSKYADFDSIMRSVRAALAKNNLCFMQQRRQTEEGPSMLHTILSHSSGEWIKSVSRITPTKNDPQSYGSALSYLKRYDAQALLGITTSNDTTDDDGENAMQDMRQISRPVAQTAPLLVGPITQEQLEILEAELVEMPDIAQSIKDYYKLNSLAELPKKYYMDTLSRARKNKETRKGIKPKE